MSENHDIRDGKAAVDDLKYVLDLVNSWLLHAERKNALQATIACAAAFAALRMNTSLPWIECYRWSLLVLSILSAAVSAWSFIPQVRLLPTIAQNNGCPQDSVNPFFFGQIAQLDAEGYLKRWKKLSQIHYPDLDALLLALSEQITTNARIAVGKYTHYTVAIWLFLAAITTPFLAGLLFLLDWYWRRTKVAH